MKSKASVLLMEQLVMILVFALAAVLCLQVFVYADWTSREMEIRDRAVALAQNGAEILKTCGNLEEAAELLGGTVREGALTAAREALTLKICRTATTVPGLARAEVRVADGEDIIFTLTVAWQEVAE